MRIPLIIFLLTFFLYSFGQLAPTKNPAIHSELKANDYVLEVSTPEIQQLVNLQKQSKGKNVVFPVGKLIPVQIDLMQKVQWAYDKYENRIGKLKIYAAGATGLGVYFSDFFLPIGSKFYAYNPSHSEIIGPFGFIDNPTDKGFGSGTVSGEYLVLEIFIPKGVKSLPQLKIEHLGYELNPKKLERKSSRDFGDSDDCQVNVLCGEGDNWSDKKNAVVRIKLVFGGFEGWCTGTILNNTTQDCTPFILTADHCRHLSTGEVAKDSEYANWEFYFQYESTKCKNPNSEGDVTISKMTGCTRKASSENGGEGDPDFLLLQLNNSIPQFYKPHFAGWDRRNIPATSGVMIHHPAGDIKKISTFTRQVESSEWDANLIKNTHWKLVWAKTKNGFGGSEGGSSGSAMWNQDKRVVGQLTGGSSACQEGNGTGPFNPDYFGKFYSDYLMDIKDSTKNLEYWLDRGKNNPQFIDGINWPCSEKPLSKKEISLNNSSFKMYPNPARDKIRFKISNESQVTMIIYDVLGNKIMERQIMNPNFELDISNWSTGIYMVNLIGNNSKYGQKLIVQ